MSDEELREWLARQRIDVLAERDALQARVRELEAALSACDVVMDTAAMHGLPQSLPPAYRDSWAAAHLAARDALTTTTPDARE